MSVCIKTSRSRCIRIQFPECIAGIKPSEYAPACAEAATGPEALPQPRQQRLLRPDLMIPPPPKRAPPARAWSFGVALMVVVLAAEFAFAYRGRPELHKRWIVAASAALCGAALGRVVPGSTPQYLLLWLSPLLALIAIDLLTRRRVHWIPVVSIALLVVAFFKVPLYSAPVWRDVGSAMLRPFV